MKRFALALALGSMVAAAVVGSAASLGGITSSLGADDALVGSCDTDGVSVTYTLLYASGTGFTVDRVLVNGIDASCGGKRIDVVLTRAGASLGQGSATVATTGTAVISMPAGVRARDVDDIHIAIN